MQKRGTVATENRALKPEAPAFLNLDVRPAAPRFASEVAAETVKSSLHIPEVSSPAAYSPGFGSQSLASFEPPSFEPTAKHETAAAEHRGSSEDSAIGGFLDALSAQEERAKQQRHQEEAELEQLDIPAFMRHGSR
jgi:hypothetical protein